MSGAVRRDNNVVVRSLKNLTERKTSKTSNFDPVLTHETNHVFWKKIYGTYKPLWLCEGIACHISKMFVWPKNYSFDAKDYWDITDKNLEYAYIEKRANKDIHKKYYMWAEFTRYLIRKKGKKTISLFMEKYSKNKIKENYQKLIPKYFGDNLKNLYTDFQNTHRKYIGPKKL